MLQRWQNVLSAPVPLLQRPDLLIDVDILAWSPRRCLWEGLLRNLHTMSLASSVSWIFLVPVIIHLSACDWIEDVHSLRGKSFEIVRDIERRKVGCATAVYSLLALRFPPRIEQFDSHVILQLAERDLLVAIWAKRSLDSGLPVCHRLRDVICFDPHAPGTDRCHI